MIMSTSYIISLIGAICVTMLFIYYQKRIQKDDENKKNKSPFFYSAIFFISACLIHSFMYGLEKKEDLSIKNVFKNGPIEMKTGTPPF